MIPTAKQTKRFTAVPPFSLSFLIAAHQSISDCIMYFFYFQQ
jgi:hypothetical protein